MYVNNFDNFTILGRSILKTLSEKEQLLVTSIFSIPQNAFHATKKVISPSEPHLDYRQQMLSI